MRERHFVSDELATLDAASIVSREQPNVWGPSTNSVASLRKAAAAADVGLAFVGLARAPAPSVARRAGRVQTDLPHHQSGPIRLRPRPHSRRTCMPLLNNWSLSPSVNTTSLKLIVRKLPGNQQQSFLHLFRNIFGNGQLALSFFDAPGYGTQTDGRHFRLESESGRARSSGAERNRVEPNGADRETDEGDERTIFPVGRHVPTGGKKLAQVDHCFVIYANAW